MHNYIEVFNFILIKYQKIDIKDGLTCLVGNSGSGKSLFFKALQFLLDIANKVDFIGEFNDETYVIFKYSDTQYKKLYKDNNYIYTINNITTSQNQFIKQLKSLLLLVGQNSAVTVFENKKFINLLDSLSDIDNNLEKYQTIYNQYKKNNNLISKLEKNLLSQLQIETYKSILQEINNCPIQSNEQEEKYKQQEKYYLNNIEKSNLYNQYQNYITQIKNIFNKLDEFYILFDDNQYKSILNNISHLYQLIDNINQNEQLDENIDIEKIQSDLYQVANLKRKLKIINTDELITIKNNITAMLQDNDTNNNILLDLKEKQREIENNLQRYSYLLSVQRKTTLSKLKDNLYHNCNLLSLINIEFITNFKQVKYNDTGNDQIEFLININNKTISLKQLSGGEKSRFLLAFYCAFNINYPFIFFDEIDNGISGENSYQMGQLLLQLANNHNVFVITHSSIITSMATNLYLVNKHNNKQVETCIKYCDQNDKINVVNQLIHGTKNNDLKINYE